MKKIFIIIVLGVFLLSLLGLFIYGVSDSGRLIRDYGFYSSGISDDEVKSIWCYTQGFQEPYKQVNGKQFCGELEVEMECIFSNSGDYCLIKLYDDAGI